MSGYVIKRDGRKVEFNEQRIVNAVQKAFYDTDNEINEYAEKKSKEIAEQIKGLSDKTTRDFSVEEIQDIVEEKLMACKRKDVARKYIIYRNKRTLARGNSIDKEVSEFLGGISDYWNNENSNKDAQVVTTQRDYMAGILSTDYAKRFLLPEDVVEAHEAGIIHQHDMDYMAQNALTNCCLVNLEDVLQNGTMINGVKIDKPHRLLTATTIATQVITAVASAQFGGTTITLTHLAPFVRESKKRYIEKYRKRGFNESDTEKYANEDLAKEISDAVQTFNYQVNSMSTTNGQAPFLSVCMYLTEDKEYIEETALLIEEFLNQRILGMKNEKGVYVTPAFPKLLYVLEECNITEDSPYWYLTVLAAKCTAKRMVPDYISANKMREYKINKFDNGDVYPCMGCVDGQEVISYKYNNNLYVESFERMWNRLSRSFVQKIQPGRSRDLFLDLHGVEIYDNKEGWTKCKRIIKNISSRLMRIKFSNGRILTCTPDHPFETETRGVVRATELTPDDVLCVDKCSKFMPDDKDIGDKNAAWLYGLLLCDSSYEKSIVVSLAAEGEEDIKDRLIKEIYNRWNLSCSVKAQARERKGVYQDIRTESDGTDKLIRICNELKGLFGGVKKYDRQIPNEVFSWGKEAKMAFLAGMMDADGYIDDNFRMPVAFLGSTNKELALQQAVLIQSLGMRASIYLNHYRGNGRYDSVRYTLNFYPQKELIDAMVCEKKKKKYSEVSRINHSIAETDFASVLSIEEIGYGSSYDVTTDSEHFTVSGIYSHNCRSFLTPDRIEGNPAKALNYNPDKGKYYGRFNMGVTTINLVDVALSSNKNEGLFWKLFEERTELCHKGLRARIDRLEKVTSDVAPILWQHGAFARLEKGEKLTNLIHGGYSTVSLGYAGLYECVKYMTGHSHSDGGVGEAFGLKVMQALNDKCTEWKLTENIDYSLYGAPIESTTYKFAKCLKKRFGEIEGITDKNYITNSYHIPVFEEINAFEKLRIEAKFQQLSPGGAISYIECADLTNNTEAVLAVIKFIYDNIMYAELNTKSDYCQVCGYDGEMKIDNKMKWYCPNCGNTDQHLMNVARRTCGYIGSHFWNYGRTQEIKERYVHLGGE